MYESNREGMNQERTSMNKEETPDQAKESVKNKVAKGVATVAGALEGFAEEARKNDLPEKAREALQKAGETTRKAADTTREEGKKIKDSMQGGGGQKEKAHIEPVLGPEKKQQKTTTSEQYVDYREGRL